MLQRYSPHSQAAASPAVLHPMHGTDAPSAPAGPSRAAASPRADALVTACRSRRAGVAVIGLGHVGLPLACAAAEGGFHVTGFDVDPARVRLIARGEAPFMPSAGSRIAAQVEAGRLAATGDFARLAEADVIVICVPTPITPQREPDLSHVTAAAEEIARRLRPGQLIVLESTTWPGTTDEVMRPILERGGLHSGKDFFLAFSPEREDPGNAAFSTGSIPKVVGADDPAALQAAAAFYEAFVTRVVPVSSSRTAEAVKLTENIFRSVNIALMNELKIVFHAMGVDIWEVIEAAKSKPFGYMPFYPGPGLGGHCIPIDPFYLTWKAREYDLATHFVELAGEINSAMPRHVMARLGEELDRRQGRGLKGSRILVAGAAYKRNVGDLRESPALKLLNLLIERGADVAYHDPHVPRLSLEGAHGTRALESRPLSPETLRSLHAVLIVTDHDAMDYACLADHAPLIVDTRNALAARGLFNDRTARA